MYLRRLAIGLVAGAAVWATGCTCCHKHTPVVASAPPCCPPAVAPVPAAPAPVQAFSAGPTCPNCLH